MRLGPLAAVIAGLMGSPGCSGDEPREIASVREALPELWAFLEELGAGVETGSIGSNAELVERCRRFYTADRMAEIEAVVPGWRRMASYADGKTLWHVNVAMLALLRLDEYRSLSPDRRIVQEWIVLLHDLAKEPVEGRDHRHAFRSAAQAGRVLPGLGFPVTDAYRSEFPGWSDLVDTATRFDEAQDLEIHDNARLGEILDGAARIFPEPTRSAVGAIALHQSITSLAAWPVKAPLTDAQVAAYLDRDVLPVLAALTLADSGGWNLFAPEALKAMYAETRAVFRELPRPASERAAGRPPGP